MYSLAKFTDQAIAILENDQISICEVYYDYEHPCNWKNETVEEKGCYLLDLGEVLDNSGQVIGDPIVGLVCDDGKEVTIVVKTWTGEEKLTVTPLDKPTAVRIFKKQHKLEYYIVTFSELMHSNQLNNMFIVEFHFNSGKELELKNKWYINFGNLDAEDMYIQDVDYLPVTDAFIVSDRAGHIIFLQ